MEVKDQFIEKPFVAIIEAYSRKMQKYNGYYLILYNRVRTEHYTIIFCEDNTLILCDSTKNGIDSIRSIDDFKTYGSSIDKIYFETSTTDILKLMIKFENGGVIEVESPYIKDLLKKFNNIDFRYYLLPKED